jgi:soluble lytic murein transglycosylase-like protein
VTRLILLVLVGVLAFPLLASCSRDTVPDEHKADIRKAAKSCKAITPELLAAQLAQESGWDPAAESPVGAQGIAQFMPPTWSTWGRDADGDGVADPFSPPDAIRSQGRLMCHLHGLAEASSIDGDRIELALAAYNAGWGSVQEYGGIPPFPETTDYVREVLARAERIDGQLDRDK